jgi:hypothetical protein
LEGYRNDKTKNTLRQYLKYVQVYLFINSKSLELKQEKTQSGSNKEENVW